MAEKIARLGFSELSVYDGFTDEWSADTDRPLKRLERYQQLIPPAWVHALIGSGNPAEYDGNRYVLCHAHFDDRDDYEAGHIPGAVFGNCGSDAYHMENYRNFDYTTRSFEEIVRTWREGGIVTEKHIAFYCGTGWRASEAFMNAYLMGWPHIAVYDGGWYEWSSHPDLPIETAHPA